MNRTITISIAVFFLLLGQAQIAAGASAGFSAPAANGNAALASGRDGESGDGLELLQSGALSSDAAHAANGRAAESGAPTLAIWTLMGAGLALIVAAGLALASHWKQSPLYGQRFRGRKRRTRDTPRTGHSRP